MTGLKRVDGRATWLLGQASARAHALLNQAFSSQGVRGHHYRLLAALDQYGRSSQAELGRYASIDRSDVVATLNDLITDRLAQRRPDPTDRRRNLVTITPKGKAALERLDRTLDAIQAAVLEPLSERERTTLVRLLTKLVPTA